MTNAPLRNKPSAYHLNEDSDPPKPMPVQPAR